MAKKTETRIEERNRLAAEHRAHQNPLMRAVSGTGLALANGWDRLTSPFKNDRVIFGGTTAFGMARGAALGAVAGILGIAIVTGSALAPFGIPIFLGATALGAAIAGIKDGQLGLEKHWGKSNRQFADRLAEKTGAVPAPGDKLKHASKNIQWDLDHLGEPSRVLAQGDAALGERKGFVENEARRRMNNNNGQRSV